MFGHATERARQGTVTMVVMETTVVELFQHDAHTTPVAHLKPKTLIRFARFSRVRNGMNSTEMTELEPCPFFGPHRGHRTLSRVPFSPLIERAQLRPETASKMAPSWH